MTISEIFLREFDGEMETTRRVLERVPSERLEWSPHPKSMTMKALAGHVAELANWGVRLDGSSFEVGTRKKPEFDSVGQLVAQFDENVAASRTAIARKSDEDLRERFTVTRGGTTDFQMSKASLLRRVFLNHLIHHRGQLSVYLRLNDVPLPPIYGPSADEG
ncbi:MAG TPA: DinB family protein [Thermoanaerobaculia bacterium]